MSNSFVRRYLFGVLGLAAAGLAQAQTLEIYAGGATFRNTPAHEVPLVPMTVAIAPDGMVYVEDGVRRRLLRFDPVNNTATALPGLGPQPPWNIVPPDFSFHVNSLAVSPEGVLIGADWDTMFQINIQEGTREIFSASQWPMGTTFQMVFDANGNLYYLKRNNAIYSATDVLRRSPWGYTERLTQGSEGNFRGDGGPLEWAGLSHTRGVALDSQGNLYLADSDNNRVRKITAINGEISREESIITTVAGNGQWYSDEEGVPATSTGLADPEALAIDAAGNLYIHERGMNRVRRVSAADGTISTYAGNGNGYSGDGGPAVAAGIGLINGNIALDAASNLYLAEMGTNRVRRVDAATGIIDTVLGNGTMTFCREVSPRREACLGGPQGIAVDAGGNVFISDSRNLRIRRIDAVTGELRTFAGTGFSYTHGGDGGPATAASFAYDPGGISFDGAGNLLIAGSWANNLRRVDTATGIITTIAGTGGQGFAGDGGLATAALFNGVSDVTSDAAGNIYVSDSGNNRIRRISTNGVVSTIAGNGVYGFSGDGGPATAAALQNPTDIKVDAAGNVLFVDLTRLRRIDAATGIITTIAGTASGAVNGDGGPATAASIGYSFTFMLDGAGNILLGYANSLRRIDATTGIITSISPPYGMSTPEGRGIEYATAMAFSPQGALFVADSSADLVFRIDGVPNGVQDTTPPVIASVINGDAGVEGWYRSNVAVSWSVSDAETAVTSSNGCSATSVSEDTAGVTFTCSATSAGGTATQSVTIRRDTVAPVLTITDVYPQAPDALGWYNTNIAIGFGSNDALSGVYSESSGFPLIISTEGTGVTGQLIVTDRAGNTTTYTSPAYNLDLYPPTVSSSRNLPQGNNDWYTGNAQVDWDANDPISPIRSQVGCDDFVLTTDTPGTTFSCTATSAGGTLTGSLTLKRDATPPTLVFGPPSPAPNAAGWHSGDVSFPFTTSDGTSGVASTSISGPVLITGEGAGLTATVTVTDVAGNSASFTTPAVNIARTPPVVQPVVSGTLGSNGWYTSNVQVSWNVTGNIQSSSGCATSNVVTDTAGVTFTCTATSAAGTASQSVTVKRDATAPVLTFGTPSPAPNTNGWNKTNVSISFTRSDAMSGLASTSATSPIVLSTEGAGITAQVVVTDLAGNTATFTTVPRSIDKAAPYAEIQVPEDSATYGFYANVIAQYECVDISLVSCTGPNAIGELINTKTAGLNSYKITAKDQSLFTTNHTHTFTVSSTFNFDGFLAPANDPPTLNLVTRGSLVPVRWRLPDGHGGFVSNTASFTSATVATLTCGSATAVPLNDTASGSAGISFDASTNTFTYNWQTTASWTGCRKLTIKLKDNSTHELRFKFQ